MLDNTRPGARSGLSEPYQNTNTNLVSLRFSPKGRRSAASGAVEAQVHTGTRSVEKEMHSTHARARISCGGAKSRPTADLHEHGGAKGQQAKTKS